jgi:mannan endo-1,4-beta-mannosidase
VRRGRKATGLHRVSRATEGAEALSFWDGYRWRTDGAPAAPVPGGRPHRVRDIGATLLMILGVVALVIPLSRSLASMPVLAVTPGVVTVGGTVLITGSNFPAKSKVQLEIDGAGGGPSTRVSPHGSFRASLTVPNIAPGQHAIQALATSSSAKAPPAASVLASVSFSVTPNGSTSSPSASPTGTQEPSPTAVVTPRPSPVPTSTAPPAPTATPVPTAVPTQPPSLNGFVQTRGTSFSVDGAPFVFTGMTIYDANSRTVSTCWDTLNEGTRLSDSLSMLDGQEVFRAWFYQGLAMTNGVRDWSAFDKTLAVAAAHNMRVLVSLSGEGGDCKDYPVDQHKYESWYRSGYKLPEASGVSYLEWIAQVASRYRNNPAVFGYQLMGEAEDPIDASGTCSSSANATLKAWADTSAATVKSADPNHLVTVGVIGTGQCGASGTAYQALHAGSDIDFCTTEDYGHPTVSLPGDQWNGMLVRIAECGALGKPIIVTESGIQRSDPNRVAEWDVKMAAQFDAGIRGILIWDWSPRWISDGFEVMPGDPALSLLRKY